jgi:hypothetical protein
MNAQDFVTNATLVKKKTEELTQGEKFLRNGL